MTGETTHTTLKEMTPHAAVISIILLKVKHPFIFHSINSSTNQQLFEKHYATMDNLCHKRSHRVLPQDQHFSLSATMNVVSP